MKHWNTSMLLMMIQLFIDLAVFTLCKNTIRKQAMLEVQRLHKRSEMFFDDLIKENLQLALHKNFTNEEKFLT